GGVAAWGTVLTGIVEIMITFLPGGDAPHGTIIDWFTLFQEDLFMGLRNLGLLNLFFNAFAILIYMALYAVHRHHREQPFAMLAAIISFLGIGVFFATNRAFPMLALSQQYAAASTEAQRVVLEAGGQAMLAVGSSHTPGTFLAFFLIDSAGILISVVMLRSMIFGRAAAYVGILGFGILLVVEFLASFVAGVQDVTILLFMFGGILSMVWNILIARGLVQFGKVL
ncbi:MAG: DUF4386 family protein, partial [Chloroflexi bacterium]